MRIPWASGKDNWPDSIDICHSGHYPISEEACKIAEVLTGYEETIDEQPGKSIGGY
ncbi:hypothetical protein LPW36_11055 [Jinshanibacter sp. LJY008]|uniref:Uncharacterized protein n=1 Tax=Limnobaculum eriocheiris TaxID=2897391 RepID=A0A9X1SKH2_9GAMM|nr:hypothetical protein [Limnobaculum eriocheiris]MCD1126528.1 hypothetical protein [Limnobaculum eriocheiris]